jgi:hypothetical protein
MINLELNPEQAAVLTHILGNVGGRRDDYRGYRRHAAAVLNSLYDMIGVDENSIPYPDLSTGTIMYNNEFDINFSEIAIMDNIIQMFSKIDSEPVQPAGLTPYQLGRFAYQNDEDRVDLANPFTKEQFEAYHGWRKGWFDARYDDLIRIR